MSELGKLELDKTSGKIIFNKWVDNKLIMFGSAFQKTYKAMDIR